MGIISKKSKIAIGIILFIEFIFLIKTFIIYSFYKNDEMYGDGIHDPHKYDKDFLHIVLYSIIISFFLSVLSILIFNKKNTL